MCTNLVRSPACTHGLQYSLRPYGNLGSAAASGRHAPARSMLVQRLKQPGPHGKPTSRGQSVRGNRWPEQRYQSSPAARLDHDHRGGSEENASEQLSTIPRRRTMRRQKIGNSGENWFPEVSMKRPSSNKSSAARIRTLPSN